MSSFSFRQCMWTVVVSGTGWGDEVSWELRQGATVILSGGGYGNGYSDSQNTMASGPLEFNINTQGTYNDNNANYTVSNGTSTVASGTITGRNTETISGLNCPLGVVFSNYAADPTTSTSFAHRRGANETPKFTIESPTSFNAVQFELNTQSNFSGTATVSTIGDGSTYAANTLHYIWTTTPLPTDNTTYFARCRVSSDGGTTWGAWTTELWPYSYFSPTIYEEEGWYYTTGEQFNTGVVQETLYDFMRITTTAFPDNGNVTLDQGAFSINAGTGDAVKENGVFYPGVNYKCNLKLYGYRLQSFT